MNRPTLLILSALIALCAAACGGKKKQEGKSATAAAKAQPNALDRATVGATTPAVDIVAFVGFQCPHSKAAAQTVLNLAKSHPDSVRVRVINLPLDAHNASVALAKGFVAARKLGKWRSYWDHMFSRAAVSEAEIEAWAKSAGVDVAAFNKTLASQAVSDEVAADAGLADTLGVAGTPSYLVNGALLQGARPAAEWNKIIANQVALSKQKFGKLKGVELQRALVKNNSPKRAPVYISHVIEGKATAKASVPVKVQRKSGVVSAKLMPAGGGGRGSIQLGGRPAAGEKPGTIWKVSVRADDPIRGATNAPVTLVVFADYECKHSKALQSTLAELSKTYGESLRVVHKHNPLPFHKNALPAAEAAEAARAQGKFWQMHDALYQASPALDRAALDAAAKAAGLDMTAYDNAMTAHGARQRIQQDVEQVAATNARGTPNLFINGVKVVGAKGAAELKPVIDAALAKAKALLSGGTQEAGLYDKLVAEGKLLNSLSPAVVKLSTRPEQSRGPAGAMVHIVAFEDFQCPFSARLDPHVLAMEREFPNRVKVSWVDFPLSAIHPDAQLAAEAGKEAAAQGKFWAFHDVVMAAQREGNAKLNVGGLADLGKRSGLDTAKLVAALKSHKWAAQVAEDAGQAKRLGLKGTPSVFINGHAFKPQLGFSANTFRSAIQRLLSAQ